MSDVVDLAAYKASRAGALVAGSAAGLSVPCNALVIRCASIRHGMSVLDDWLASGVQILCPRVTFEVVPPKDRIPETRRAERPVGVEFSDLVPTAGFFEGLGNFLLLPFRWIWE